MVVVYLLSWPSGCHVSWWWTSKNMRYSGSIEKKVFSTMAKDDISIDLMVALNSSVRTGN